MKTILNFLKSVGRVLALFVFFVAGIYVAFTILSSGYEYEYVGNKLMRAWHVRLPGYQPYLDIDSEPLVHRERFVMRAYYRVGPWIDQEPALREEPDASP